MKPQKLFMLSAGLYEAVIGRHLLEQGHDVTVVDARDYVAGNCHADDEVWDCVSTNMSIRPYKNQVNAATGVHAYSLPIKLHTINPFFGKTMRPDGAQEFIETQTDTRIAEPQRFEEQDLRFVGHYFYEAFVRCYTLQQQGRDPTNRTSSILKRLPVPFNYDGKNFEDKFQGMPTHGYTKMAESDLGPVNITEYLNIRFNRAPKSDYHHVFYFGPLDGCFDYDLGRLGCLNLDFNPLRGKWEYKGCPVVNYDEESAAFTPITEHKYFSSWEAHESSIYYKEYSGACEQVHIPSYPISLVEEQELLRKCDERANVETGITFVDRLSTFRCLDMDVTVREALDKTRAFEAGTLTAFVNAPI